MLNRRGEMGSPWRNLRFCVNGCERWQLMLILIIFKKKKEVRLTTISVGIPNVDMTCDRYSGWRKLYGFSWSNNKPIDD
jgi:hypothetical protein